MTPIDNMTSVDKAQLLHGLFPGEIFAFVEYVKRVCQTIREDEDRERQKAEHAIIGFDFWLHLVSDTERRIDRYGKQLHKRAGLFADQLFDGQHVLLMQYCLKLYTVVRRHDNRAFTDVVRMLFRTDAADPIQKAGEFKEILLGFEQGIVDAVAAELQRIGRPVSMEEFPYVPFAEDVWDYMEAIRLEDSHSPVLDCSFRDVKEKHLSAAIAQNEIDHWDMIALLELLGNINPLQQ